MLSVLFLSTILVPILNENGATFKILGLLILRRNINLLISVIMAGTITAAPTVQGVVVEPAAEAAQVNVAEATSQEQGKDVFGFDLSSIIVTKGSTAAEKVRDMIAVDGYTQVRDLQVARCDVYNYDTVTFQLIIQNSARLPYVTKDGAVDVGSSVSLFKTSILQAFTAFGYGYLVAALKDVPGDDSEIKEENEKRDSILANILVNARINVILKAVRKLDTYETPFSNKTYVSKGNKYVYHISAITLSEDSIARALA